MFTRSDSRSSGDQMKRSSLRRSTRPLERRTELERKTRISPVNRSRRAKAFARNFGERSDAIREMPCLVHERCDGDSNCAGRVVAAHVQARGMGGAKGDRRKLVPLCWHHHEEASERRTSKRHAFEMRYEISLEDEADRIAGLLDDRGYE
jgi:hypothetical protein